MLSRYASCATYEDRGESVTTFTPTDGSRVRRLKITFETAFERAGGGFRFEYQASGLSTEKRGIVWRETVGPARSWWSQSPATAQGELSALLLSVHAGTSGGTSQMIPALLLGRPLPWTLGPAAPRYEELEIPIVGRAMTLFCRADDHAVLRWTSQHRRMRMGALLDHDDREPNPEAEALLASSITQEVTLEPAFDRDLPPSRFARMGS